MHAHGVTHDLNDLIVTRVNVRLVSFGFEDDVAVKNVRTRDPQARPQDSPLAFLATLRLSKTNHPQHALNAFPL